MRLIFLFTQQNALPIDQKAVYDPSVKSRNHFAANIGGLRSEGYSWLLRRMIETKVVDEVLIFIESNRYPGSTVVEGMPCHVVPNLGCVDSYLKPNDIIWVRGGFRQWHNWLAPKKGEHWLMLYAANTGRARWKFWDVILDDLRGNNVMDARNRAFLDFHKPIHPKIFYTDYSEKRGLYDVCVGSSHIHEKKGQFRTIQAIAKHHELFGPLNCVMPGRMHNGVETGQIPKIIEEKGLNVLRTGMIERPEVNKLYNRSKLFIHLGGGGQNDRGPLEALRCGTQVLVGNTRRFHKVVYQSPACSWVCQDFTDPEEVAYEIKALLEDWRPEDHRMISRYFEQENGIESVCLPEMRKLFDVFRDQPKPDYRALREVYHL